MKVVVSICSPPDDRVTAIDTMWVGSEETIDPQKDAESVASFVECLPPLTSGRLLVLLLEREAGLYDPRKSVCDEERESDRKSHGLFMDAAARVRRSMEPPGPLTEEEMRANDSLVREAMRPFSG